MSRGHPRPAGQARRPAAQHAHAALHQGRPTSAGASRARRMEIYAPLAERIGMHAAEGRARGPGLRRAQPGRRAVDRRAPELPARAGRRPDRRASSRSCRRCSPRAASTADGVRGARRRPIRSGARCSARTSRSSSSPTSWPSASSSTDVARLLPRAGRASTAAYRVGARPLQGLHLARRSRTATSRCTPASSGPNSAAHRGADPHPRDARGRRDRRRRALGLQAGRRQRHRRQAVPLAARAARHPGARLRAARNSSSTPSSRCSRTRCSASRRRAT